MEPASIGSLVGTCIAITHRLGATVVDLNNLRKRYHQAAQSISILSSQVTLTSTTLSQPRQWLNSSKGLGRQLRIDLRATLNACQLVIVEIQEHVSKVNSHNDANTIGVSGRVRRLWGEVEVKEYERQLSHQFQAISLFLQVVQVNKTADQQSILSSENNQRTLERARDDASIYSRDDTSSITLLNDNSSIGAQLGVDYEIATSGPYLRQFRRLMKEESNKKPLRPVLTKRWTWSKMFSGSKSETRPQKESFAEEMCEAAMHGKDIWIEQLISHGANVNVCGRSAECWTPLHHAAANGHESTVRFLIKYGAKLDARDQQGMTPLHVAAQNRETFNRETQIAILKLIIDFGAILDSRSKNGATALHYAAASNTVEAFPCVHKRDGSQGFDELSVSDATERFRQGQQPQLSLPYSGRRTLTHKTIVFCKDQDGRTALHWAVRHLKLEAVRFLLVTDSAVNQKDNKGMSALHMACLRNAMGIKLLLLQYGADSTARDNTGRTIQDFDEIKCWSSYD